MAGAAVLTEIMAVLVLSGLFGEQVEHSHQRIQEMSNGVVY
jgi:hypothetical protein